MRACIRHQVCFYVCTMKSSTGNKEIVWAEKKSSGILNIRTRTLLVYLQRP